MHSLLECLSVKFFFFINPSLILTLSFIHFLFSHTPPFKVFVAGFLSGAIKPFPPVQSLGNSDVTIAPILVTS